jgi:hypothetical protein
VKNNNEKQKTKQNLSERDIVKTRYSIYCRFAILFFEIQNMLISVSAYTVLGEAVEVIVHPMLEPESGVE